MRYPMTIKQEREIALAGNRSEIILLKICDGNSRVPENLQRVQTYYPCSLFRCDKIERLISQPCQLRQIDLSQKLRLIGILYYFLTADPFDRLLQLATSQCSRHYPDVRPL